MVIFFFQAEDGIRDKLVTGVQTCALPISRMRATARAGRQIERRDQQAEDQRHREEPADEHQRPGTFSTSSSTVTGLVSTRKLASSSATRVSRDVSGRTATTSDTRGATRARRVAISRGVRVVVAESWSITSTRFIGTSFISMMRPKPWKSKQGGRHTGRATTA